MNIQSNIMCFCTDFEQTAIICIPETESDYREARQVLNIIRFFLDFIEGNLPKRWQMDREKVMSLRFFSLFTTYTNL